MIRKCFKKIVKDNTGASIALALLFFIVCAVVGIVVLSAGTAAAGRVSQMRENDKLYYSVTSAAQLLKEETEDVVVTVTQTRSKDNTSGSYKYSAKIQYSYDSSHKKFNLSGDNSSPTDDPGIGRMFAQAVNDLYSLNISEEAVVSEKDEEFWSGSLFTQAGTSSDSGLTMSSSVTVDGAEAKADFVFNKNGSLKVTVYNNVEESENNKTPIFAVNFISSGGIVIDDTINSTTETRTTTFRWNNVRIVK